MKKLLVVAAASALLALPAMGWAHGSCDSDLNHCAFWHDSEGIYINDSSDRCVKTSSWSKDAVVKGCTAEMVVMELDSDGDGVGDSTDLCPDTPAGAPVDKFGCPLDSDWDGVPDYRDKCPNTPSGATVNKDGCEVIGAVLMKVDLHVNFAFNSDVITSDFWEDVTRVADFMKKSPEATVWIEGHTDITGAAAYNQELSQRRADAVAARLTSNYGIAADRITAVGYGEGSPIADNATKAGRAENRRVVAVVKGMVPK